MSSRMKQVFVRSVLEAVLAAAAERPPSNEGSPAWPEGFSLGGLRRSFVTEDSTPRVSCVAYTDGDPQQPRLRAQDNVHGYVGQELLHRCFRAE